MNFANLTGLSDSYGNVVQIADAAGRVIWKLETNKPVILEVEKITSDTYAGETTYTDEQFILLDIYPKTNGTVTVTYGGLTKTITDTSGVESPNAQQVFFGTFNGVSDSVATPDSGTLIIEGECRGFGQSSFEYNSKSYNNNCFCVTAVTECCVDIVEGALGILIATTSENSTLISANLGYGTQTIGSHAFAHCTGLTSINLPNSLKTIVDNAFMACTGLTSINLPNSLKTIGGNVFSGCTGLTNMIIPKNVKNIGRVTESILSSNNPFRALNEDFVLSVDNENTAYAMNENCLFEISTNAVISGFNNSTIPSNTQTICEDAFDSCTGLTSITIPSSVTAIEYHAFNNCTGLTSVAFENTSGWYVTKTMDGDASTGTPVDVSNPANNATMLTDTYLGYYWYRS